jgi:tripartite-type tricarboxylate transporter receptor subunit TctC
MREQGFADYEMTTWVGIATVAGVPAPILARMEAVTLALLADPAVQRRMTELGFELLPPIPQAEMLAFVAAEREKWAPVIRATGATRE